MRWRVLRCVMRSCPGYVVSGWHSDMLWIGWRCLACGKVKHYQPTDILRKASQMRSPDVPWKKPTQH